MSLPASWVDALFARMAVRYAQSFERNYDGMDMDAVKADWAQVLDGVSSPSISYALVNLPVDWPPNAMQFKALCVRGANARTDDLPQLPAPKADPARLKAAFERMHEIAKERSPTAWIADLEERRSKGEKLSTFQTQCLAQACINLAGNSDFGDIQKGSHTFLQEELPPDMRTCEVDPEAVARLEQHVRQKLYAHMTPREITQALRQSGDIPAPDARHLDHQSHARARVSRPAA